MLGQWVLGKNSEKQKSFHPVDDNPHNQTGLGQKLNIVHTYGTVRETRLFAEKENPKSHLGLYLAKMSVWITWHWGIEPPAVSSGGM